MKSLITFNYNCKLIEREFLRNLKAIKLLTEQNV